GTQVEAASEKLDELAATQRRIVQVQNLGPAAGIGLERRAHERCLPGPGLAKQQRDALPGRNTVLQIRQLLTVARRHQQVLRVGAQIEGELSEPVEGSVHV